MIEFPVDVARPKACTIFVGGGGGPGPPGPCMLWDAKSIRFVCTTLAQGLRLHLLGAKYTHAQSVRYDNRSCRSTDSPAEPLTQCCPAVAPALI